MNDRISLTERSLPIMLLRAREVVMQRFRPLLKAHGLSEQQWRVLRVLNEGGPAEPTRLAEECVILLPSLTRILAHLEEINLIARRRHDIDKRRQIAEITDAGRAKVAAIAPESLAIYASLESDFGSRNLTSLMDALRRLTNI